MATTLICTPHGTVELMICPATGADRHLSIQGTTTEARELTEAVRRHCEALASRREEEPDPVERRALSYLVEAANELALVNGYEGEESFLGSLRVAVQGTGWALEIPRDDVAAYLRGFAGPLVGQRVAVRLPHASELCPRVLDRLARAVVEAATAAVSSLSAAA